MDLSLARQLERSIEPLLPSLPTEQLGTVVPILDQIDRLERNYDALYETMLSYLASISDLCPDYEYDVDCCDECGEAEEDCCCPLEPCECCGKEECCCEDFEDEEDGWDEDDDER